MGSTEKCPFSNSDDKQINNEGFNTKKWWPKKLDLSILDGNNDVNGNELLSLSGYRRRFMELDLLSVKKDIMQLMTCSQDWWPADYGHYGPFFIRMAWHSAGTYRSFDGRGGGSTGNLRLAPLNSWPDNGNLDKARRLLWPIKQKYGSKLSWADLMIFAGNCALESMGLEPFGFGGGREDIVSEENVYWGPEQKWLADCRHDDNKQPTKLQQPLGAVQMGLIYVNPEGRGGNSGDFEASAADIRETFGRMSMNDEETVALIAGGHTFGKAHGASSDKNLGPEPEGAMIEEQGLGWKNAYRTGKGPDTITSGLEGAWTSRPTTWDNGYFDVLFGYEWKQTKSPAGATQWIPANPIPGVTETVPDAHDPIKKHVPIMFTTDLVLRYDPIYGPISKKFHENPQVFADAFSRAWYKLTHRDMGPRTRYLGKLVPHEMMLWQDPVPQHGNAAFIIDSEDMEYLKFKIVKSGLSISELVSVAWASASTYRVTDHRGGANGARIRFQPQIDWKVNNPPEVKKVLKTLAKIQQQFNQENRQRREVSLADLIVLGGCAAIERAIENAGYQDKVPFYPGRTDAQLDHTDTQSFSVLEQKVDGFRNYSIANDDNIQITPEEMLVDRAYMLRLSAVEMTVLLGGMRVLNANTDKTTKFGVFTEQSTRAMAAALTNDFFLNLLDLNTSWRKIDNYSQEQNQQQHLFEGYDTKSGRRKWIGTRFDLTFGSNSQLRAIAESYACDDSKHEFIKDFVKAWNKVMNLDRFDLSSPSSSFSSKSIGENKDSANRSRL